MKTPADSNSTSYRQALRRWWDALVRPDLGGELVLSATGPITFDLVLLVVIAVLYATYGATMGLYRGAFPATVSAFKLPFLYVFTLLCCGPYLYVINAQIGPRLTARGCVRMFLLGVSANAVALASYAPVSAFFAITSSANEISGYRFLMLMHVAAFAFAGFLSVVVIGALVRAVGRQTRKPIRFRFLFAFGLMYGVVGSQMAWVLRPWVGSLDVPYAPFRAIEGSFIESVYKLLTNQ